MKAFLTMLLAVMTFISAEATIYNYSFANTPVSDALVKISKEHPEITITFIYKELDNYTTSVTVRTENPYEALRRVIGHNPISIIRKGNEYYIEALQHGKFVYTGRAVGSDDEPVAAATVMLLAPKDSTVLTYAVADSQGRFSIPCDSREVIAKLCCIGYHTVYRSCSGFNIGTVIMPVNATQLGQVKVEAQAASAYPDRTVYIPNNRHKNASQNATDLLRQMAIPQIYINPEDNSVKDNAGTPVTVFINYMQASQEEMKGLRTADVRRVEYLENPMDPRFRGVQRAINIIVQEYVYGGYTKISADETAFTGLDSETSIFSKFAYKKMTYDLFVASNNWRFRHLYNDTEGTYSLKDNAGNDFSLVRKETTDKADFRENQYPVTFRATYNTEKVQIRNTVGYSHTSVPVTSQIGTLSYVPETAENHTFERINPERSNSMNYNGTFYFALPKDFSIDVSPEFTYTHNNNALTYSTSSSETIYRYARENAYNYRVDANINKRFGQKHTLMFGLTGGDLINRLRYSGNAVYSDRFNIAFVWSRLCYRLMTKKFNLYADAGVSWEESDINGFKNHDTYIPIHISSRFTPNSKNAFGAHFFYVSSTPGIIVKVSDVLQENEFMYITGNPALKNFRSTGLSLDYSWIPSNQFTLNAFYNFSGTIDRMIAVYEPFKNGQAVIRTLANDGNFIKNEIGLAANLKLFNNNLQLYARPTQSFYHSTGTFNKTYNPFQFMAQATYYLNQFYFMTTYRTPAKWMFSDSPILYKSRCNYSFAAGWSNRDWNIRLTGYNIFNTRWDNAYYELYSPFYKQYKTQYGVFAHAQLNLTVTYTFGYGKKVQRGNEVGEQRGAASAIIK